MAKAAWEKDAEEFGRRFRFGEWESGLLVARSVEPIGAGRRPTSVARSRLKATVEQFAEVADIAVTSVRRYLKTWNLAAKDGLVPPAEELLPGGEMLNELPEADLWKSYFRKANPTAYTEADREITPSNSARNAESHLDDIIDHFQKGRATPLEREEVIPLMDRTIAKAEWIKEAAASAAIPEVTDWDAALAELNEGV